MWSNHIGISAFAENDTLYTESLNVIQHCIQLNRGLKDLRSEMQAEQVKAEIHSESETEDAVSYRRRETSRLQRQTKNIADLQQYADQQVRNLTQLFLTLSQTKERVVGSRVQHMPRNTISPWNGQRSPVDRNVPIATTNAAAPTTGNFVNEANVQGYTQSTADVRRGIDTVISPPRSSPQSPRALRRAKSSVSSYITSVEAVSDAILQSTSQISMSTVKGMVSFPSSAADISRQLSTKRHSFDHGRSHFEETSKSQAATARHQSVSATESLGSQLLSRVSTNSSDTGSISRWRLLTKGSSS